ncbi:MAG: class I SAM-dependent methyltransferase [Spongiibacteraceae bacterium]|nr:class I SAM-dependent methyltransferase [Spongiibacteraceae bacterium]
MSTIFSPWRNQQTIEQLLPLLAQWFVGEAGTKVLNKQRERVSKALTHCFGYHLLQLSADANINLFNECRVQKKYRAHPFASGSHVRCQFDALPFENESLDVVIVHHVHEFVSNPHLVLREMQRIVVPHGHLIIIGFNPWSRLGLYSSMAGLVPSSMWQNQLISTRRMKDWLCLLGFEIDRVEYGFHCPELIDQKVPLWMREKFQGWPFGNFYMVSAIKQVATMTPVKLSWVQPRKQFAGLAQVKPRMSDVIRTHHVKENVA